ncbi:MAG: P1 family peptidase [Burkholderiaceae bacterium]|nr:P1 family peptidase [Burkholderiaceae bacterium]
MVNSASGIPKRDAITDVAGVRVGHCTNPDGPTGCTVVLVPEGAVAAVDVRGAAPGTRETELLAPSNLVGQVHAVLLAGGSAFGLDAAGGVMRWLEERGIGFPAGPARVPIVPAAILFDLAYGDHRIRPDASSGYAACEQASDRPPAEGSVGAGAGATVGKLFGFERAMKGGIASASVRVAGFTVGAIVAVNAMGDVVDSPSGAPIAGARTADGRRLAGTSRAVFAGEVPAMIDPGIATTIGVIATDARLSKAQAQRVAWMGHDGMARAIDPVHTMFDGDTLFALATGRAGREGDPTLIGIAAADVVARAVRRAVRAARAFASVASIPAARELEESETRASAAPRARHRSRTRTPR